MADAQIAQEAQDLAAKVNQALQGQASYIYRYPPAQRKELWQVIRKSSWKALVALAPGSDVWKLKKKLYTLKKRRAAQRFRSKVRSYVSLRYKAKPMARSRFGSGNRRRFYRRGYASRRTRW